MRPARAVAAAKINLALVVGPRRDDGLHDVATVLQRIDVCDRIELQPGEQLSVAGFPDDTIVAAALTRLAAEAGVEPAWSVRISKEIPVAAGLGGGSADAAAALRLANERLPEPLAPNRLHALAASLGSDVPFFLEPGPKLAEGAGERLTPVDLPQDFWVAVAFPRDVRKSSTREVYERYDALAGGAGFEERRAELLRGLAETRRPADLAHLPANDLAEASGAAQLAAELRAAGAFRADVSGAGPAVYGLFQSRSEAQSAGRRLGRRARARIAAAVW
jgi:4-diphosphocytidyl-2-C-methyl-D-erythritol kinase